MANISLQDDVRLAEESVRLAAERLRLEGERRQRGTTAFFIQQKEKRDVELLAHYKQLCDIIIGRWVGTDRTVRDLGGEDYERAETPLYIVTSTFLEFGTHSKKEKTEHKRWLEWTLEHVKGKSISNDLEELKRLDDRHNEAISTFIKKAKIELDDILNDFEGLLPQNEHDVNGNVTVIRPTNYYIKHQLLKALEEFDATFETVRAGEKDYYLYARAKESRDVIARAETEKPLLALTEKIEASRKSHKEDYKTFLSNSEKDSERVARINEAAREIIMNVNTFGRLDGECEYERTTEPKYE